MKSMNKILLSGIASLAMSAAVYGSESATGVLNLQSVSGSGAGATYTYDITLKDTGTTNIGTFWYAWLPPDDFYDFLTSKPTAESSPTGWTANLQGEDNSRDGNSIQWVSSTNPLTPGTSLTFGYTTPDNPASVTGGGVGPFPYPTGYSYIYIGAPETDAGSLVNVAVGDITVPEPATLSLLVAGVAALCTRRPRRIVVALGA
jgi:hypothetical protein